LDTQETETHVPNFPKRHSLLFHIKELRDSSKNNPIDVKQSKLRREVKNKFRFNQDKNPKGKVIDIF
jgi:hypothetical protein